MFKKITLPIISATLALSQLAQSAEAERCPAPTETRRYVETKVFPDAAARPESMSIFYFLAEPVDAAKPFLVYLSGGPGDYMMPAQALPHAGFNVVYVHHRGLGCSRVLSDYRPRYTEPYFSMAYAAADLDEVRKDLLGPSGKWFVYGISYGGMLAQTYALKYPDAVSGLILDSTFYGSSQITAARDRFLPLFFPEGSEAQLQLEAAVHQYPEVRTDILRLAAYSTTYQVRTVYLPMLLKDVAAAPSLAEAEAILAEVRTPLYPMVGMAREITCRELWDYPQEGSNNTFYFPGFDDDCRSFKDFRAPFDTSAGLRDLHVRTMLWSGQYDPVTPSASMQRMQEWIQGSLLWTNLFAGHGLIREKPACAESLLELFAREASDSEIRRVMDAALCQSPPPV